jgi:hypothetical protein
LRLSKNFDTQLSNNLIPSLLVIIEKAEVQSALAIDEAGDLAADDRGTGEGAKHGGKK